MVGFDFDPELEKAGERPAEGWYDATVSSSEHRVSRSGNDMVVMDFTFDNGPHAGASVTNYFVFGTNSKVGEATLTKMSARARSRVHRTGFVFGPKPGWDEFAEQFLTDPPLRVRIKIRHERQIETDRGWKKISKREAAKLGDDEVFTQLKVADFDVVKAKATLEVTPERPTSAAGAGFAAPAATQAPAEAIPGATPPGGYQTEWGGDGARDEDDELPF